MPSARFVAEIVEGHKGVTVVIVPFDPEKKWRRKPVRLAGRRHGWLVRGTLVRVVVSPTSERSVLEQAMAQSKRTTQPKKLRADVIGSLR